MSKFNVDGSGAVFSSNFNTGSPIYLFDVDDTKVLTCGGINGGG